MLIGRRDDLDVCLRHITNNRPLVLVADAGLGKTTLLRHAATRCRRSAFLGRGLSTLSWTSFLSLETALGAKFPTGDLPSVASTTARRVSDGVLILDDLQWGDDDTLKVLPYLSGRTRMLTAVRTDDPNAARVRSALAEAGFVAHELGPLSNDESEALLLARRPDLSLLSVRDILRNAGGNPFLLEELSWGGRPSETLRISFLARLERMSLSARRGLSTLALLGRPGGQDLAGDGLGELVDAGLVTETAEGFTPRHSLLAEAAIEHLNDHERRRIHASIASKASDLGEAAVHHDLAGNREAARENSLMAAEATEHIGQRARLLLTAAKLSGDAPEDDEIRLRAAEALVEASQYEDAYRIASEVRSKAAEMVAEALLYRARALRGSQGLAVSHELVRKGIALVAGSGSLIEIRLLLEELIVWMWEWRPALGVPAARHAQKLALGTTEEAAATQALGTALIQEGSEDGLIHLQRAMETARGAGDLRTECEAAFHLVSGMKFFRRWRDSLPIAAEMRVRAIAAGLRGWEVMFVWHDMATLVDCAGDLERGILVGFELIEDLATPPRIVRDTAGVLAVALLDTGRMEEAWSLLKQTARDAPEESPFPGLAQAELELAAGDPQTAIEIVDQTVQRFPHDPNMANGWVTRGWACLKLGREQLAFSKPFHPAGLCYVAELDALAALGRGDLQMAESSFDEANRLAHDFDIRTELRCLWQAGEAAARAGSTTRAKMKLLEVEARAQALGMKRLLAHARASLRAIGVRHSAPRKDGGGTLSGREREVIALVANGHRSRDIAARLGIAPSTVDSMVRSAMRKLNARTRTEAARRYVDAGATDI